MTNKQKALQVLQDTFNMSIDADFFYGCHVILPDDRDCATNGFNAICDACKYDNFWEQEYVASETSDILSLYNGLSDSMQRAVRNVMRVGNGLEIEKDYVNDKLRKN